ncbi:carbohydrate ABC transporter permease [Paenibacillus xylanilyticus]|uniref:Sugar ABC transporter permease n=1 Tax=Paenibacillus xylanilyticus TaxID=248903 RepID=A0A7Y6EZ52_9BACL|nr:sugar ABC transporter permease [Paenibacillus xylanilyticus]NUU79359.1 sugar ABC transporter permease [Paenibacillus xylanilyticus]
MYRFRTKMIPYLFVAPAILLLAIFSIVPIIVSIFISFTDMDLVGLANWSKIHFIGIDNFIELFNDKVFIVSMLNTMFYVCIGVPVVVLLSLVVALLLNYGNKAFFSAFRTIYYLPTITNIVAIAVIWSYLYNQQYGLFNYLLSLAGTDSIPWLEKPFVAKISLLILAVWQGLGVNMIIFLAALKSIPEMYYEAAEIDGANRWQRLCHITLPSIRYAIFFVVVTKLIGWLQFFEEPFVMTGGGPLNGTISMALFIYQEGFQYSKFGYAAASSTVLFAVIIVVTMIQFKLRREE